MKEGLRQAIGDGYESKLFSSDFKNNVTMCNKMIHAIKHE
jgi:hypothetical protein